MRDELFGEVLRNAELHKVLQRRFGQTTHCIVPIIFKDADEWLDLRARPVQHPAHLQDSKTYSVVAAGTHSALIADRGLAICGFGARLIVTFGRIVRHILYQIRHVLAKVQLTGWHS